MQYLARLEPECEGLPEVAPPALLRLFGLEAVPNSTGTSTCTSLWDTSETQMVLFEV